MRLLAAAESQRAFALHHPLAILAFLLLFMPPSNVLLEQTGKGGLVFSFDLETHIKVVNRNHCNYSFVQARRNGCGLKRHLHQTVMRNLETFDGDGVLHCAELRTHPFDGNAAAERPHHCGLAIRG